jgi:hypothetical protein
MAGKSLGTLTIDLVAKVGGFVSGMDKAERASAKWSKQVQDDVAKSSAALAGIGAAAIAAGLAVGASGFQLLKSTSRQIAETDRWAKSLQLSTQELLAWQFAAEKAGVSGDQMADIFKDIGDKIGDAVLNKSGEAVDALNALGLSAEKPRRALSTHAVVLARLQCCLWAAENSAGDCDSPGCRGGSNTAGGAGIALCERAAPLLPMGWL